LANRVAACHATSWSEKGPKGLTRDQLYNEAKQLGVEGRSRMNNAQLQRAVDRKKS
jgi:hypothetical protein